VLNKNSSVRLSVLMYNSRPNIDLGVKIEKEYGKSKNSVWFNLLRSE